MNEIVEASTLNEGLTCVFVKNSSLSFVCQGVLCVTILTTHYMHAIISSFLPSLVGDSTCSLNVGGHEHLWETRGYYSGKTHSGC
jgi:hypothetical protein